IGGGLLVFRLAHGPLALDVLAPALENALSDPDGNFRVRIAGTELWLTDDYSSLEIRARQARVENRAGATLAVVPELSLGLSLEAFLTGILAPTRIVVPQPSLRIARDADGTFQLGIGSEEGTSPELTQGLLHEFLGPADPGRRAGALRR